MAFKSFPVKVSCNRIIKIKKILSISNLCANLASLGITWTPFLWGLISMLLSFMFVQLIKSPFDPDVLILTISSCGIIKPLDGLDFSHSHCVRQESFCVNLIWLIYLIDSKLDSFLRFIEPRELSESSTRVHKALRFIFVSKKRPKWQLTIVVTSVNETKKTERD